MNTKFKAFNRVTKKFMDHIDSIGFDTNGNIVQVSVSGCLGGTICYQVPEEAQVFHSIGKLDTLGNEIYIGDKYQLENEDIGYIDLINNQYILKVIKTTYGMKIYHDLNRYPGVVIGNVIADGTHNYYNIADRATLQCKWVILPVDSPEID